MRDLSTGYKPSRRFFTLYAQLVGAYRPATATGMLILHRTRVRFQAGLLLVIALATPAVSSTKAMTIPTATVIEIGHTGLPGDTSITSSIVIFPKEPIQLTTCSMYHQEVQFFISATWVAHTRSASAVKIRMDYQNAFGETLQTDYLTPQGKFDLDEPSSDQWTVGDSHMPPTAVVQKLQCTLISAILGDGKVWRAPAKFRRAAAQE